MMEEALHYYNNQNEPENLRNYVQNITMQSLISELSKICMKENGSVTLQILFKGLSNSAISQGKKTKICLEVINNIQNKVIPSGLVNKLINVLANEVDNTSSTELVALINNCLKMMQTAQDKDGSVWWKELLPQLLNIIVEKPLVEYNGTTMTGEEYKSEVVSAIFMYEWKGSIISNVASMFIEMPLTSEEHIKVVNKLCKFIHHLKLDEVPPLVHQILQLTKQQNSMPLFIELANFFESNLYHHIKTDTDGHVSQMVLEDKIPLQEVQVVEGTILYHIYTAAISLGPKSIKDFVKNLKECIQNPQFILRPFFVTLLLNVSCISHSFEEEILSILTCTILRSVAEEEKKNESAWIESAISFSPNVEEILNKVLQNCFRDRDRILQGLIKLAFSLLGIKTRSKESQNEKLWNIGSSLLVSLVHKHSHVTGTVFQNLVHEISQVQDSTQYTDCLTRIASKRPLRLLDCSEVIIQLLGNICARLSPLVGQRVLAGILPLVKMSSSLRDNLLIFLRKALFSEQSSREMAVYGFLELLKDLRISDMRSLSQSVSQNYVGITQIYSGTLNNTAGAVSNEGMCLEILTILKQVFEYSYHVKIALYKGVYDSFYLNPKLGTHILDTLKTRFEKFFKGTKEIPPVDFNTLVTVQGSSVIIQEPIAFLILGMALIAAKTDEDYIGKTKFSQVLDSMCQTMSNFDITNLGLQNEDANALWDDGPETLLEHEKLRQILGVYEALIGYVVCSWKKDSLDSARQLDGLFKGYSKWFDFARGLGKSTKKKQSNKTSQKDSTKGKSKTQIFNKPQTVLNFKCASRLLAVLNGAPLNWLSEDNLEFIKAKRELHRYAFNVTLDLIFEARSFSPGELYRSRYMLQYISFTGRILYLRCISRLSKIKEFDYTCAALAVETFLKLLEMVFANFKPKLSTFFTEIGVTENDIKLQIKKVLDSILEHLIALLDENFGLGEDAVKEETQMKKLCLHLISTSSLLINQLPRDETELPQILNNIRQVCKEKKIGDSVVAKSLLTLLLNTYMKSKPSGGLILDLILCLCDSMSLIDDEMEIDDHEKYAIINMRTANMCLMSICDALHNLVQEVEWMVIRCKAELLVLSFPAEEPLETRQENLIEKEKEICRHLNFSIKALSMICTIAVPPGNLSDVILKEIGHLYSKLVLMTKYFILKFSKYHQTFLSAKFDKTIKMADHELTKNMYCFTEHVISEGSAIMDDPPLKKQKNDAVALKVKVLKETKIIPKIIFEKEQFQKFVLQLSNRTKIDVEMKQSMTRDYRLYTKQVKEIIEKENFYEQEMNMNDDEESQNESNQPAKKSKVDN